MIIVRTLEKDHGRARSQTLLGDGRNRLARARAFRRLEKLEKRGHGRSHSRSNRKRENGGKAIFHQVSELPFVI